MIEASHLGRIFYNDSVELVSTYHDIADGLLEFVTASAGRARDLGCLIVFDNVHDHRIVDEFWPLPGTNTAVIVITSDESIAQAYAAVEPQTASSSTDSGGTDTFEW